MPTPKTLTIYPSQNVPSMHAKSGRAPGEGVPLRWLEALVQDIHAQIPNEQERNTCTLYGAEQLRVEYQHTLSPEEALTERVRDLEERRREARGLLPRQGEPLRPEELARLQQLLEA